MKANHLSELAPNELSPEYAEFIRSQKVIDVEIPIKGLLIRESVAVSECSGDRLEALSSNISHFCTGGMDYPLFIKLKQGNKALSCRLSDVLVYSGKLFMNDFRLMNETWMERQCDRVQPRTPIYVSIVNGKKVVKANLFDLSLMGMSILVGNRTLEAGKVTPGSKLRLFFTLPTSQLLCEVEGTIVQNKPLANHLLRLGMSLNMPVKTNSIIAHYLAERKREILDELIVNFRDLIREREVAEQYF